MNRPAVNRLVAHRLVVKRAVAAVLLALVCAACGASTAQPTPRPSGRRGPLLNQIDKARDTANRTDERTSREEGQTSEVQRYGGEYEQGENYPP